MVWLEDSCEGGGTHFPRLSAPEEKAWCKFIECDEGQRTEKEKGKGGDEEKEEEEGKGITFKPMRGNAVYWENMRRDGRGWEESWHAGLPVRSGRKIGLSIWSWLQEGWEPRRGTEEGTKEDLPREMV